MALLSLVFGVNNTSIGALQLDALVSEQTTLQANITSYAVESGVEKSDHITEIPEELSLSGVVTGAGVMMFTGGGRSKLIQAKETLRQIHRERMPITIVTGTDIYVDYGMTSANIIRNNVSEKLEITASFKRIITSDIERAEIPESATDANDSVKGRAGKTARKAGSINDQSADTVELEPMREKSWLKRVIS